MNDPVERAFQQLRNVNVPDGPPDALIQRTLRSIHKEIRNAERHRVRQWRFTVAVAAAALVLFGLTVLALKRPAPQQSEHRLVSQPPPIRSSMQIASAFIEADQLAAGQTFLLPLHGTGVTIDPATWPDDLLSIN